MRLIGRAGILIGVLLLLHPSAAFGSTCRVTVFFGNGIYSDPDWGLRALIEAVRSTLNAQGDDLPAECFAVSQATERTIELWRNDLLESGNQWFAGEFQHFWQELYGSGSVSNAFERAFQELLFTDPLNQDTERDLAVQISGYDSVLHDPSGRVIVVAHSQGNFFVNEAFHRMTTRSSPIDPTRFDVVGVATPASVTVKNATHVTLYWDVILLVPGRLNANTEIDNTLCHPDSESIADLGLATARQLPGPGATYCHSFDDSYLKGTYSRNDILDTVLGLVPSEPRAVDDVFTLQQGTDARISASQVLANDLVPLGVTPVVGYLSPTPTVVNFTSQGDLSVNLTLLPQFVGSLSLRYAIHTSIGTSNVATIMLNVVARPPNQAPTAGFSMSVPSESAVAPGTLNIVADAPTGEARITFVDQSTDPDGASDIISRRWTTTNSGCTPTNPPPCLLSDGLTNFTWGFKPGGPYVVRLTVTDSANHNAFVEGSINVDAADNYTVLYFFPLQFLEANTVTLTQARDGTFYGTTAFGGGAGIGTIFKMNSDWSVTTLYEFGGPGGAYPPSGLLQASDGNFYGVTSSGVTATGALNNNGIAYKITPTGEFTLLHTFDYSDSLLPSRPVAALLQASDGNFYGTAGGGFSSQGTIFRMTPEGVVTVVHTFSGAEGSVLITPLVQGGDGSLYGVATAGGAITVGGTVFRMAPDGAFTILHTFTGGTDGSAPDGLVQTADGTLYGTSYGTFGLGTVFSIRPDGTFAVLHTFTGGADGAHPNGSFLMASDGKFYGITEYGGGDTDAGTIFRMELDGAVTVLHSFTDLRGRDLFPENSLIQAKDGALYGTNGFDALLPGGIGGGLIFRLNVGAPPPPVDQAPSAGF